jgi:hypothetical protein
VSYRRWRRDQAAVCPYADQEERMDEPIARAGLAYPPHLSASASVAAVA